jgi:hypothetical protein
MAIQPAFDPNAPIPNNPFYSPYKATLASREGELIVGDGLFIDSTSGSLNSVGTGATFPIIQAGPGILVTEATGVVTVTNAGVIDIAAGNGISLTKVNDTYTITNTAPAPVNYGTVTEVTAGTGLAGGPITTTGSLSLAPVTTLSPGTYSYATITVDQYGRVTLASPGTVPQDIQGLGAISVSSTSPQVVSVATATTTSTGVVSLDNTTSSNSSTKAATANAVKVTYDFAKTIDTKATNAAVSAANALGAASSAQSLATTAAADASAALSTANSAQSAATSATSTANSAQADATQAVTDSATALSTATAAQNTANSKVSCSTYAAKGQILVSRDASDVVALSPGGPGEVLTVDSEETLGVGWSQPCGGTVTSVNSGIGLAGGPVTSSGSLYLANTSVTPGTYTYPTITVDAQGRLTGAGNATVPLLPDLFTTKGQIITATSESDPAALPIGDNGQYLRVNKDCGTGLEWTDTTGIPETLLSAIGSVAVGSTGGVVALPVGGDGQILVADSNQPEGLKWAAKCPGTVTCLKTGTGLQGGPVTSSGTISLSDSGVVSGQYSFPTITVDNKGRITNATSNPVPTTTVNAPLTNTGTGIDPVLGVNIAGQSNLGVVKIGTNIDLDNGVISLKNASTLSRGLVILDNSLTSTNTAKALTAAQGKVLKDLIDSLNDTSGHRVAGTYDPVLREVVTVTPDGHSAGFVIGADLPTPGLSNDNLYVISTSNYESYSVPPGPVVQGGTYNITQGDWLLSDSIQWHFVEAGTDITLSTTSVPGVTRFATPEEMASGTSNEVAVTPAGVSSNYLSSSLLSSKGSILTSNGSTSVALPLGNGMEVLVACPTAPSGLAWSTDVLSYRKFTDKGFILSAIGPGLPIAIAPGAENQILTVCSACPTGLAWSDQAPQDFIPCNKITAKGDIIVGSSTSNSSALPIGAPGQFLTVNPSALYGLEWATYVNEAIPCSTLANKGDLVSTDGAGSLSAISVGTNGQVLKVCSACPNGLFWDADGSGGGIPTALFTEKAQLVVSTAVDTPVALSIGADGQILTANSCCAEGVAWTSLISSEMPCSVLTDKGYLITANTPSTPFALAPGSDGQVLKVCACCDGGLVWEAIQFPVNEDIPCSVITSRGDILVGDACGSPTVLPVGNLKQILEANPNAPLGLAWRDQDDGTFARKDIVTTKGDIVIGLGNANPVAFPAGNDGYILRSCSTAPCGLIWGAEAVSQTIPCSVLQGKGDLVAGSASGIPIALPAGSEGYVLKVCSSASSGLAWGPDSAGSDISCSEINAKGDIIVGADSSVPTALSAGADGQVLKACSGCVNGLVWVDEEASCDIPCSILTARGQFIVALGPNAPAAFPVGTDGQILRTCNLCQYGIFWSDDQTGQDISCSIVTGKGQLIAGIANSQPVALTPGTDGYVLSANSNCNLGLEWVEGSGVDKIPCSTIAGKGTLIVGSGQATPAALSVGPDNSVLVTNSTCPTGVDWNSTLIDTIQALQACVQDLQNQICSLHP